jgi:hypothetical protein
MIEHFWRAKLVPGGPFVGVKTFLGPPLVDGEYLDRSPRWQAIIRNETTARAILMLGNENAPVEIDGKNIRSVQAITKEDYLLLIRHSEWATKHAPHLPDANPETPIDWMKVPL